MGYNDERPYIIYNKTTDESNLNYRKFINVGNNVFYSVSAEYFGDLLLGMANFILPYNLENKNLGRKFEQIVDDNILSFADILEYKDWGYKNSRTY